MYLKHFNPYHDDLGRFASKTGHNIKKGTTLVRYSDTKESDVRKGTYLSYKQGDVSTYEEYALSGALWFKNNSPDVFKIELQALDDIKVRNGRDVVRDVIDDIGNAKIKEIHSNLEKIGYYNPDPIIQKQLPEINFQDINDYKSGIREYMKDSQKVDALIKKYSDMNYDAFVDPEDFDVYADDSVKGGYRQSEPIVLINPNKVKTRKQTKIKG